MRRTDTVRFRYPQAIWAAGVIAVIGSLPVAGASWFLAPVLLVPLAVTIWAWRAGTDADPEELRLRALLGQRRVPWRQVVELATDARGRAVALLADGRTTTLPAVRGTDLPRLIAVTGQSLPGRATEPAE
ncbi:PH domain-containing protein [Micromonospora sp. NPDC049559]|uniref:PH domain-containing protein n=1 Tax=Micromonospora sp. NPDC049559 TaxID=3155923 RepID=UPI00342014A3